MLSLLFPAVSFALSSDHTEQIKIKADSVTINEKTGISTYLGNVLFTQGSLIINGTKVIIHQTKNALSKIIVHGTPATFQQEQDDSPNIIHAKAGKMTYITKDERVYLETDASVSQGDNLLTGNEIEYNTRSSTVTAKKGSDGGNRVNVVIEPAKNNAANPKTK